MYSFLKLVTVAFCFFLSGCHSFGRFDQQFFLKDAFNFDLLDASEQYVKKEKNGLLVIEDVEANSNLLKKAFPRKGDKTIDYVPIFYNGKQIGDKDWGGAESLIWKSFDGYHMMSIYYPNSKTLIFGYFDGIGG